MSATGQAPSKYGPVPVASARTNAALAVVALAAICAWALGALVVPWLALAAIGAGAGYSLSGSV